MTPSTSLTIGLITLATALPAAAQAQLVGTYNGTQANGAPISLTVTKKTLDLSGLGVGITTTCPDAEKINENTGIGFQPVPIPKPKFTFELLANPELYVKAVMTFDDATKSVSGMITSYVPALDTFTKHPRQSETCISAQNFTASLGGTIKTGGKPKLVIYEPAP
jgi:hypothetical protein